VASSVGDVGGGVSVQNVFVFWSSSHALRTRETQHKCGGCLRGVEIDEHMHTIIYSIPWNNLNVISLLHTTNQGPVIYHLISIESLTCYHLTTTQGLDKVVIELTGFYRTLPMASFYRETWYSALRSPLETDDHFRLVVSNAVRSTTRVR
jgi:hypothetical protein